MTLASLTAAAARDAAQLAAVHRLRGADAIYAAVARRYATTLVTRDDQARTAEMVRPGPWPKRC